MGHKGHFLDYFDTFHAYSDFDQVNLADMKGFIPGCKDRPLPGSFLPPGKFIFTGCCKSVFVWSPGVCLTEAVPPRDFRSIERLFGIDLQFDVFCHAAFKRFFRLSDFAWNFQQL